MQQKCNTAMMAIIPASGEETPSLDPELSTYLSDGIAIDQNGAIIAVSAAKHPHTAPCHFDDIVSYEAFVNKIHIDDWSHALSSKSLSRKVEQAALLADEVGRCGNEMKRVIVAIVSADEATKDVVFRFHGLRATERPWVDDIEGHDPILIRVYDVV